MRHGGRDRRGRRPHAGGGAQHRAGGAPRAGGRPPAPARRAGDLVAGFAGKPRFVLLHAALVAGWAAVNAGLVPGVPAFDPYPFGLLGVLFSLEGVLLASFVLMKQNRMGARAEQRSHLDLQVSLLAEQEVTKVIQMLERVSARLGIEAEVMDAEAKEMGETTAVGGLARRLSDSLPGEG